jgi:cyclic dehypoxanthinyl futalosine synthase
MNTTDLLNRALEGAFLSAEEGKFLFDHAGTAELMHVGNAMRWQRKPEKVVTWIIDRNVNTTNVCIANCKFCNFYRIPGHEEVIHHHHWSSTKPRLKRPSVLAAINCCCRVVTIPN